jgi:hypothetical protein
LLGTSSAEKYRNPSQLAYPPTPLLAPLLEAPFVEAPLDDVRVAEAEQRRACVLEGATVLLGSGRRNPSA